MQVLPTLHSVPFDSKDPSSPATTSSQYDVMAPRWRLIHTVLGGTESMRQAAETRLPRHTQEGLESYKNRLTQATLLNTTELTLNSLCGKPFVESMKFTDVPDAIMALFDNVDLQGNNIDSVAASWFKEAMKNGFAHMLVDTPRLATEPGQVRTLADDRNEKVRPYLVPICPSNVIFAMSSVVDNEELLTHVRIRETFLTQVGFAQRFVSRIRVMEPGLTQIWEDKADHSKPGQKEVWEKVEEYETSVDFIPIITFYSGEREELFLAKPPLLDLAHLNVTHWQSSSDQRNILTVGRFPMLACSGVSDEESIIRVGPNQVLMTADSQGKFYYVEHTGAAIAAGQNDLDKLERMMASYGAEFLKVQPDRNSATSRALDSAESLSPLQAMVNDFQSSMKKVLRYLGQMMNVDLPETAKVELDTSWGLDSETQYDLATLQAARTARDISRETYLAQLKRQHILPADFDADLDADQLKEEQGSGLMNLDPAEPLPGPAKPDLSGSTGGGSAKPKKARSGATGPKPRGPNQGGK